MSNREIEMRREIRRLRKYLKALATEVTSLTAGPDGIMKADEGVDRGKCVARIANGLNTAADSAMHFGLHMDFKDINKMKRAAEKNAPQMPQREFDMSSRFGFK